MFNIDYQQLIKEQRVYFVKYGRGGTIGVTDTALNDEENNLIDEIRDAHQQYPQQVHKLENVDDSVIIELECDYDYDSTKKIRIQKKIPLYQITFETYDVLDK
ncbi:hypothetical protein GCM10007916_14340 [Psychromonas marina]|uniref:Uncharacterized protein n=1 Tax=Psychromonas marina TaxID=88364 RepID=A0ABQ6DYZ5_9GAMM|nr:hypothetical protein [Psychromonas marina]GLS90367.1 hypothetical protein GCM10007916_14340 [Psychromonas marina]